MSRYARSRGSRGISVNIVSQDEQCLGCRQCQEGEDTDPERVAISDDEDEEGNLRKMEKRRMVKMQSPEGERGGERGKDHEEEDVGSMKTEDQGYCSFSVDIAD